MAEKESDKRVVLVFEGKAGTFRNTEAVKVDKTGAVEESMTYDLKIEDEDGHGATLRSAQPWNVRPGEWVRIRIERTQARIEEAGE